MKTSDLKHAYGDKVPVEFHNTLIKTLNKLDEMKTLDGEARKSILFGDSENTRVMTIQPKKTGWLLKAAACSLILSVGFFSVRAIYPTLTEKTYFPGFGGIEQEHYAGSQPETDHTYDQPSPEESQSKESNREIQVTDVRELNLVLHGSESAPEAVKLSVNYLPEGVIENQGKYSLNGNHEEMCFTIIGTRVNGTQHFSALNIIECEQLNDEGTILLAHVAGDWFTRRFYILFEEMAVFVEGYVSNDVPDDELRKVIENITVEACSGEESNLQTLTAANEAARKEAEENAEYEPIIDNLTKEYFEISLGQTLEIDIGNVFDNISCTVDKIEVLDNISGLDENHFAPLWRDINDLVDGNGNFLPHEREYYHYGDGKTEAYQTLTKTNTSDRCLVYASITVSNKSDLPIEYDFSGFGMVRCHSENGRLTYYDEITDENVPELIDIGQASYIDNDSGYNCSFNIPAHSSKTVHIGYIEDKDQIENMYLFMNEEYAGSHINFNPRRCTFVKGQDDYYYSYACVKVK